MGKGFGLMSIGSRPTWSGRADGAKDVVLPGRAIWRDRQRLRFEDGLITRIEEYAGLPSNDAT